MTISQSPSSSLLHRFRSDRKHLPLHPLEKSVLTVVVLHLCFLPWALGTMHVWSQLTSLSFSLIAFTLALIPRYYTSDLSGGPDMRLTMWPRLLHFPLFWIGLALLAYIAIQGFNPSWVWERNATTWWLRRVNDIPWLPTSIDTPFERFNLWRQFIIYASAWLTICTVWVGFTRRRSLQVLLTILAINCIVFVILGCIQRVTRPTYFLLWSDVFREGMTPFASFIYKNHAGSYLSLLAGVTIALAVWHYERGIKTMARSTPVMLWLMAAAAIAFGVFFTYSRGATLILTSYFVLVAVVYLIIRLLSTTRSTTAPIVWLLLTTSLVGAICFAASQLNYERAEQNFNALIGKQGVIDTSIARRLDAYKAGESMLSDNWQRGIGAGGFRYLFPEYIKHYPASYKNGQLFWEHAHCDWLQWSIELGAMGSLLFLLGGAWAILALIRQKLWRHSAMLLLVLACLQTLAQAVFDFPFQNPAILLTWCVLLILALRWSEVEKAE